MLTRRRFLRGLAGVAVLGAVGGGYSHFVEAEWLDITRRTVPAPQGWSGGALRVAHVSDLHRSRTVSLPYLARVVGDVAALQPDLICLTGDYITICDRTSWDGYQEVLGGFAATAPTYAVLGNHDGGYWAGAYGGLSSTGTVAGLLDGAGIEVLENRSVVINHRGRRIRLTGVGDWMNGACRPCEAFAGVAPGPGELGLALSHNPDSKDALLPHPFHLLLCGHTHGGQIGFVPLARLFVHLEDKRYIAGLYRYQGRWLHISRGVGNLHGLRIGCRPEVTLLEIG